MDKIRSFYVWTLVMEVGIGAWSSEHSHRLLRGASKYGALSDHKGCELWLIISPIYLPVACKSSPSTRWTRVSSPEMRAEMRFRVQTFYSQWRQRLPLRAIGVIIECLSLLIQYKFAIQSDANIIKFQYLAIKLK